MSLKVNHKLLASSPTIEGIEKMINKYFYSTSYKVHKDLSISNSKGLFTKVFVIFKKGRYYLYES